MNTNELESLSVGELKILCDWIKENLIPIKSFNMDDSSYRLKHIFEQSPGGFYVTNDTFKQAMKLCGFNVKDESEINWNFNISKKSPALTTLRNR